MPKKTFPLNTDTIDIDVSELTPEVLEQYEFIDTRRRDVAALEPIKSIKNQNVPGRELLNDHSFMDPEKGYIFSCYHGNDSRYLAMHFRQQGFPNCFSLRQGYEALRQRERSE